MQCEQLRCSNEATQTATAAGRTFQMCDEHVGDVLECGRDGCNQLAYLTLPVEGVNGTQSELPLCEDCDKLLKASKTIVLNDVVMVTDGQGNAKALPRNIGQG